MWRVFIRNHPTLGPWFVKVERKPGWVRTSALLAALITVAMPLVLLAMAAMFVGVVVFMTLGAIASIVSLLGQFVNRVGQRGRAKADGRINVRVIREERF